MACHLDAKTTRWTNADLSIETIRMNFREFFSKIQCFSLGKLQIKMSWAKCRPFCSGFSGLNRCLEIIFTSRQLKNWQWFAYRVWCRALQRERIHTFRDFSWLWNYMRSPAVLRRFDACLTTYLDNYFIKTARFVLKCGTLLLVWRRCNVSYLYRTSHERHGILCYHMSTVCSTDYSDDFGDIFTTTGLLLQG